VKLFFGFDDGTTLVGTAARADMVRQNGFTAFGTGGHIRCSRFFMRPALIAP
jgi:hypothetical protein